MPVELLLLPLKGCQVILGAQWMKELGEVTLNLEKLQVKFTYNNKEYIWQWLQQEELKMISNKMIMEYA